MTYRDYGNMATDHHLGKRIRAAAIAEGVVEVDTWFAHNIWHLPTTEWETAWASAEASGVPDHDLGDNEAVITDQMILSAVQPVKDNLPEPPAVSEPDRK